MSGGRAPAGEGGVGPKLTEGQRNCLALLDTREVNLPGAHWWPREPIYCWPSQYGFSFQSLLSLVKRELVSRIDDDRHGYRITTAGRRHLASRSTGGADPRPAGPDAEAGRP